MANHDHPRQFAQRQALGVKGVNFTGNRYEITLKDHATETSISLLMWKRSNPRFGQQDSEMIH